MTEYLTEQEQIEVLKNWIKQYGPSILAGIAVALIAIISWHYWQERQDKILSHASAVYDELLAARAQNDGAATLTQAQKLFTHYPKTVYGQMAALMLARAAANKNDFTQAEKNLNWVLKQSSVAPLRQIARIRLARLLIAQKKSERAIALLDEKIDDKTFNGLIDEVKGDAYLELKNIDMARQFYKKALSELPNAEVVRPILQMKYDNLATTNTIT